ncbi:ABC transporter ATP-binding protein [Aminobacter niigataensis]|uniref:ABC transporter ATP-binding protein n=1 Tax=Aminobacter niigataensis TaxID=83265 RepID=UPI0024C510FD|nr:ABC transporter ATP-binding protein [Aminobacter niigataensis]CAI2931786.1 murein tripeptide ABC transporter/oligopeptide ABC transporter ATP binding subunit OppF [Aminobacter niigataensis]
MAAEPLIKVENLVKHFVVRLGAFGERGATVHAVDDVNFDIFAGETLSLVGESGCGKSTTGFTLLNLQKATSGKVIFQGENIVSLDEKRMRPYRRELQIVFQDPYSTLNPRMTIGEVVGEPILFHKLATKAELPEKVTRLLADVGLPARFASRYPHELSGGQRQRVAIARALACQPKFIVCDEAISALDVSVQAQIINLLLDLQEKYGLTYLFIAHDLAVVRHISDRVGVMYLGRLAELGTREQLFSNPLHPYTRALLSAVPEADPELEKTRQRQILVGDVPSPLAPPAGCRFHTRCPIAMDKCRAVVPEWREVVPGHHVACHAVGMETAG